MEVELKAQNMKLELAEKEIVLLRRELSKCKNILRKILISKIIKS